MKKLELAVALGMLTLGSCSLKSEFDIYCGETGRCDAGPEGQPDAGGACSQDGAPCDGPGVCCAALICGHTADGGAACQSGTGSGCARLGSSCSSSDECCLLPCDGTKCVACLQFNGLCARDRECCGARRCAAGRCL